ncbi:MAG TPA: hypothetical protein VJ836_04915 [Candidatus Saccharimonadales bacterium]|nr:hypothetical protein [Candidatus Saccharimonadales bacterium]
MVWLLHSGWAIEHRAPGAVETNQTNVLLSPEYQAGLDETLAESQEKIVPGLRRSVAVLRGAGLYTVRDMFVLGRVNCADIRDISQKMVDKIIASARDTYPQLPVDNNIHIPSIATYCTTLEQITWLVLDSFPGVPVAKFEGCGRPPSVHDVLTRPWDDLQLTLQLTALAKNYPATLAEKASEFVSKFAQYQSDASQPGSTNSLLQ